MKSNILLTCCVLFFWTAKAQQTEQPAVAFPFNVQLFTPDSLPIKSAEVFKTGKPTVIAFWLTTCMPCHAEFEAYSKNFEAWKKQADFNLIAMSMDYTVRFRRVGELVREKKWPFPVYWDRERAFKDIMPGGLNGLPQVFVFDPKGRLFWQHKGFRPGAEAELWEQVQLAGKR